MINEEVGKKDSYNTKLIYYFEFLTNSYAKT